MKKITLLLLVLAFIPAMCVNADDDPEPSYSIPLHPEKWQKKRMPPRYPVYLNCNDGDACLVTSMPYGCATIAVEDEAGNFIATMMVTPEENCGWLPLTPGCNITCTFDNGTILYGSN